MTKPFLLLAIFLSGLTVFVDGYLQPVGRYKYRQTAHFVKQQSYTAALRTETQNIDQNTNNATLHLRLSKAVLILLLPFLGVPLGLNYGRNPSAAGIFVGVVFLVSVNKALELGEIIEKRSGMFSLTRYISKSFLVTWLTLVFGFLALIGLLDSLANGGDIVKSGGGFSDTFRYMALRMAPAVRALQTWGIGEYKVKNITADNPLWLEDKGRIVRATQRIGYDSLGNLQFFFRDENGNVERIWHAQRATFVGPNWELTGVEQIEVKGADGETRPLSPLDGSRIWETRQNPTSIARLAAEPRDLSLSEMRNFSKRGNSGSKPSFAYKFWHAHRITRPLAALILLVACAALMQRTGREDTGNKTLIIGITMAFIFLIFDGAMATFAASGGLAVWPAISFPLLL